MKTLLGTTLILIACAFAFLWGRESAPRPEINWLGWSIGFDDWSYNLGSTPAVDHALHAYVGNWYLYMDSTKDRTGQRDSIDDTVDQYCRLRGIQNNEARIALFNPDGSVEFVYHFTIPHKGSSLVIQALPLGAHRPKREKSTTHAALTIDQ